MSKTYQIKMTAPKVEAKTLDATPGTGKAPITLKAEPGARYHLTDTRSGFAPDNIRISRSGKNLKIFTDGVSEPTFIVEDFYEQPADNRAALTGKSEDGNNYEYIPENASGTAAAPVLKDDGQIFGMALGGEVINAGAAVGLLAPVAAFNPLLLAAGAVGAAAAGGGGGGGSGGGAVTDNTKSKVEILSVDDGDINTDKSTGSKDTGSSATDFYTADNTLSYYGKVSSYVANGDQVKIELKDSAGVVLKTAYVTPDNNGNWSWKDADDAGKSVARIDGNYTLIATLVDKTGKAISTTADGTDTQVVTIDTSSEKNSDQSDPKKGPAIDPNSGAKIDITSIDDGLSTTNAQTGSKDTGFDTADFYTADNTLTYFGTISHFTANGDLVKVELKNSRNEILSTAYVTPDSNGNWSWKDADAKGISVAREDGNYTLVATLVDKAGNTVNAGTNGKDATDSQVVTIDTDSAKNTDPNSPSNAPQADPNNGIKLTISDISDDTGSDPHDFYTADNTLRYSGTAKDFQANGDRIHLELKDSTGKVLSSADVVPDTSNNWTWQDTTARADGQYTLTATVVDKAGNKVGAPTSQPVYIDTSTSQNTNGADPNADLTLDITGLVLSTKGERTGLADFYNNAPDQSKFKGTFSKEWVNNNDRLVLEIFDPQSGKLLAAETITPTGNAWTSSDTFLGNRANGTYVLRATVEDQAGNTVTVDTQSFVIDQDPIDLNRIQFIPVNSNVVVTLPEGGRFTITGSTTGKTYTYEYSGADLDLQQQLSNEAFTYTFTDYAGNIYPNGNTGSSGWSGPVKIKADTSIGAASAKTALTGDIGTYLLTTNVPTLDLSTVTSSKGNDAFNSIDLTGKGITTLTIKAHDLLDIGLTNCFVTGTNSFSKDKKYDSDIQFKVKGDSTDILKMTELTDTGNKVMLSDGLSYAVYHTVVGSIDIDVFVLDGMKVN